MAATSSPDVRVPADQARQLARPAARPARRHGRLRHRLTTLVAVAGLAASGALAVSLPSGAATLPPPPPTPTGLPREIESLQPYVPASSCTQSTTAGARALAAVLEQTYPQTSSGIARACGSSLSEHFEGRAIDWMTSMRTTAGKARADSFLSWVLAPDANGNQYAMARRLGIMYLIWNDRMWSAYAPERGWKPYSSCASHPEASYDTTCHRDHVHISLGWSGATASTSYWTRRVAPTDYGPCRPADLNWAAPYAGYNGSRCESFPKVAAPSGSSSTTRTLWTNSGIVVRSGMTGPVVTSVQKALGSTADGIFGSGDVSALHRVQNTYGLPLSDGVDHPTWRALLGVPQPPATVRPRSAPAHRPGTVVPLQPRAGSRSAPGSGG